MIPIWKKNLDTSNISKLIKKTLNKKNISEGLQTRKLEKEISKFLKVKYVSMVPSGTSALLVSMMAMSLRQNDRILIPERSWVSPLNAAAILGLKIKTIDVKKMKPILDEKYLLKTKNIKAIIVVHMGGRAAKIDKILKIAKKKNIKVIEDAAQAFGSKYKKKYLGTFSDIGCFSLSMAKTITSGQGGFIVTSKKNIYEKILKIKNNGLQNVLEIKNWGNKGLNFKYTDILSCLTLSELKKYKFYKQKMINLYNFYKDNLIKSKNLYILPINLKDGEIPQYVEIICKKRSNFIKYMKKNNIQCREFYPSISTSKFANQIIQNKICDSYFSKYGVFLPSGPHQKIKDINKVVKHINNFIKKEFLN